MTNPEKDLIDQLEEDVRGVGRDINNFTRKVVRRARDGYDEMDEKFSLNDRFIGAATGAKIGFLSTIKTVPIITKPAIVVGSVVGFAAGEKGMKNFRQWLDGDLKEQDIANDQEEVGSDISVEQDKEKLLEENEKVIRGGPRPPDDGP